MTDRPLGEDQRWFIEQVAVLRGRHCQVSVLSGGLTNRNYKVVTDEGAYVVRVSPAGASALSINREHEYLNSVIAAESGVGAPVHQYLPELRVLVVGFIEGETLTDASFSRPGTVERVARACRKLHDGARFVNDFDMFEIQRGYLRLVTERGYRLPPDYLGFADEVQRIKRALGVRPEDTVACNNDLLPGNFVDDGDHLRLIDYEYSGNNDACFELGNIWSECHLTLDQLETLVTVYYGCSRPSKVARAQLQGLMSRYGWTLWASIQAATSELDFDFWQWGMERYHAAVETFRSSRFEDLLETVQRED